MTTETPQMWDVINKMNDELAEVQDELAKVQDELTESKNENEKYKNIIKSLILKVITMDTENDLIEGGLRLLCNERTLGNTFKRFKYTKGINVDNMMDKIIDEMNDSDWNDDKYYCKLHYFNGNLETLICDSEDESDSDDD